MKNLYTAFSILFLLVTIFWSPQSASAMAVDSLELPIAAFDTNNTTLCGTESFTIRNQSSNFTEVIWEIEGVINPQVFQNGNVSVSFSEAGMYDVTLIAVNECGSDTLKVEDYLTIHDALEAHINTTSLGYECGIGEKYLLCAESDAEVESYHWFNNCLSGDNTGRCCELGLTHGLFSSYGAVSLTDTKGCNGHAQSGNLLGDWEYVEVSWVEGPLYFCEGESVSIPSGTVVCYPPGCTVSYGNINVSEPGSYAISTEVRYRTCKETINVGIGILAFLEFKDSQEYVCANDNLYLDFVSPPFIGADIYVNGVFHSYDSVFTPDEPGLYEITAVNQVTGIHSSAECTPIDTLYVEVFPIPSIELQYEEKICRNTTDKVTITANPIEGLPPYSHKWRLNGHLIEADSNVLTIPIADLPLVENYVSLITTDQNDCSSEEKYAHFDIDLCNNIEENPLSQLLIHQVAPNQLLIQSENLAIGNFNASLYDLSGRKISQQDFFNTNIQLEQIITLQNINSGIYILQLQGENGEVLQKKVWIE